MSEMEETFKFVRENLPHIQMISNIGLEMSLVDEMEARLNDADKCEDEKKADEILILSEEAQGIINSLGYHFMHAALERVFTPAELEKVNKYLIFLYNMSRAFKLEMAEKNFSAAHKIINQSLSFYDILDTLKLIVSIMNRNVATSKAEHESAQYFLKVIRGEVDDE